MSLQLYYDQTHIADPKPASGAIPAGTLTDDLDTYDLDFQHHFRVGDANHIVWGFGYRFTHDVVGAAPSVAFLPPELDRNLFNVFLQDEIRLQENLFLTLGTKIEHNDWRPGSNGNRARGCAGISRPRKCSGPRSRARCAHPRASTATSSSRPIFPCHFRRAS